jgi:flagellar biosynthesis/type III secretory pathway chaperone
VSQTAHTLSLETILSFTHNSMKQLLLVLNNETKLLKENNPDALQDITQEKLKLTEQIENSEQQRIHLLTELNLDPNEPAQWLQTRSLKILWQQIKTVAEASQKQNQINGIVINSNRHKIQTQLDILNASPAVDLVYSATGMSVKQRGLNTLAHV